MKANSHRSRHLWVIAVLAGALIAGHGVVLYLFSSHFAASAAVTSVVVLLVILKHLGLLGGAYGLLRRKWRRGLERPDL
jgi:high-affinity Fe2+/Pb2+ permease